MEEISEEIRKPTRGKRRNRAEEQRGSNEFNSGVSEKPKELERERHSAERRKEAHSSQKESRFESTGKQRSLVDSGFSSIQLMKNLQTKSWANENV